MSSSRRVDCPECETENPVGSKFCESCGLVLTTRTRPEPTGPARRSKAPARDEGREIQKQLTRARDTLKNLRLLFGILGVASLIPTALIVMATVKLGLEESFFVAIVAVLSSAFLLSAVFFLYAQPLFFTITAACLATLMAVLSIPEVIMTGTFGLIALGCWGTVPLILKIMRLKQEYPELITSTKLKRRETRDVDTAEARVRATERRARERRAAMRSYAIVGGVIIVAVLSLIAWRAWPDPQTNAFASGDPAPRYTQAQVEAMGSTFEPVVEKFADVWKRSDARGIEALGSTEFLAQRWRKVQSIMSRRGWASDYPEIAFETEIAKRTPDEKEVWFEVTPKGTLKTHWIYENDAWRIRRLVFSRTR